MLSVYNIWTVARFEMKTLLRSWFFRIFAGISISVLITVNVILLTGVGYSPWALRGIPSSVPYVNVLLLNVFQAVIAVFLASDFLKRDKKLDTTEVVYMRSMTNGDYILGKTLGILIVFIALNLIVLFVAGVFNFFFSDVPVVLQAYLYYLLLISIPTLVFIFGLSFLFMVLIRNQAVTFIVLLGYIAVTVFFLSQKFHHLFDYMAFNVPLLYSDFIGFGNLAEILIHRGIYFSLGLGFIFATIVLLKRLPQSNSMQRISFILTVVFFIGGVILGGTHLSHITKGKNLRQKMIEINNQMANSPNITITNCDLDLHHQGYQMEVVAKLVVKNNTSESIDQYILNLNPGLKVKNVQGHENIQYNRNMHLLTIQPADQLFPQSVDSITIHYSGTINEEACYLDIDDGEREKVHGTWLYNIDKRYSLITPNYVLLTPENLWYPTTGVGFSSVHPEYQKKEFIEFSLKVTTDENLTAFSQGQMNELNSRSFSFNPEQALPQISLVIGPYTRRHVTVDSIEYSLVTMKNHDYFAPYFNELGDTLSVLIRDIKEDYEGNLNLIYPYRSLSFIEVPIQFACYQRLWTLAPEAVQPQMVFLPENGITLAGADFKQFARWEQRRRERDNRVVTPVESQSRQFQFFVTSTFLSENMMRRFRRGPRGPSSEISLPAVGFGLMSEVNYSIYPNYYTHVNFLESEQWPILNIALESFLSESAENPMSQMFRAFAGLSSEEKVSLALQENTLDELLADPAKKDIIQDVFKTKGNYLFTLLRSQLGTETFQNFIREILEEYRFRILTVEEFCRSIENRFSLDFKPYIQDSYSTQVLPGFLITDIQGYEILDGNRTRYQVKFNVSNPEPVKGLMVVTFRVSGGGRGGPGFRMGFDQPEVERVISVPANQTKEVGVVLDSSPRMMMVNSLISKNVPSIISHFFEDLKINDKAQPFDGEQLLDHLMDSSNPDEIIVDNEDPGFELFNPPSKSFLKKLLNVSSAEESERYSGIQFMRPPTHWVATANPLYYGKYIRSAYYTKGGNGDNKVAWNAEITQSGSYDIYFHSLRMRRGRGRRGGEEQANEQYHFRVYHDDGEDEAIFDLQDAETGWNLLGTYYLSSGIAKVELTNESQGRIVVADAIKWVRH